MKTRAALTCFVLSLFLAAPAAAGELAGVSMPDTVTVAGQTLSLQGVGLRSVWRIKVYVAGLYLATPTSDAEAVIAAKDAKIVDMAMLRALSAEKLSGGVEEGFERNSSSAEMTALRERLDRLLAMFPAVHKGDVIRLTWAPGKGTIVANNGVELGVIEGQDFADALFACWLGEEPAQQALKDGMLGLK
jgi:hypothetical protein